MAVRCVHKLGEKSGVGRTGSPFIALASFVCCCHLSVPILLKYFVLVTSLCNTPKILFLWLYLLAAGTRKHVWDRRAADRFLNPFSLSP